MAELIVTTPGRTRLRRLRRTRALRNLVAETSVGAEQLIMPHFVLPAKRANEPISSMPGIAQQGLENVVKQIGKDLDARHPRRAAVRPPRARRQDARRRARPRPPTAPCRRPCERLKREFGDELVVMTDVCLCAYTDHGHCGVLDDGRVLNDASLVPLVAMAVSHARAGADVVAPSDMMDGRVAAIRDALDDAGFTDTALMSYAVKFASAYYGPFREAADSTPVERRPAELSDGLPQSARGRPRSAARRRGRRRLAHGEAGAAVPRRDSRRARSEPLAARRLTTSRANTRPSKRPPRTAGSTKRASCARTCSRSAAPAPIRSSRITRATR